MVCAWCSLPAGFPLFLSEAPTPMEPVNPLLPTLRPAAGLLHRAGGLLAAVRGIQQEASAEWWYERGNNFNSTENFEEAHACFRRVVSIDATNWRGWLRLGQANVQLGELQQAQKAFISTEIYGRPIHEADCLGFFTSDETDSILAGYRKLGQGERTNESWFITIESLILYYSNRIQEARAFLLTLPLLTLLLSEGKDLAWAHYFLLRIEAGDEANEDYSQLEELCEKTLFNNMSFLGFNPRIFLWIIRGNFIRIRAEEEISGGSWNYWREEPRMPEELTKAVWGLKIIAGNPTSAKAEYFYWLGQADSLLPCSFAAYGYGFAEFHQAVLLESDNKEYLIKRGVDRGGVSYYDTSNVDHIVAMVEVIGIGLNKETEEAILKDICQAFMNIGCYGSCLKYLADLGYSVSDFSKSYSQGYNYDEYWSNQETEKLAYVARVLSPERLKELANAEFAECKRRSNHPYEQALPLQSFAFITEAFGISFPNE